MQILHRLTGDAVHQVSDSSHSRGSGVSRIEPIALSGWGAFQLDASLMVPELQSRDRMGAIKELVDRLYQMRKITDSLRFLQAVLEREDLESTVLGKGIALPHARSRSVAQPSVALGLSASGIPFHTEAQTEPVHVICMVAVPDVVPAQYVVFLGDLAGFFRLPQFRDGLLDCQTPKDMHRFLTHCLTGTLSDSTAMLPFAQTTHNTNNQGGLPWLES